MQGSVIVDSTGQEIPLRGAQMPGLNVANPSSAQRETIAAMNDVTFGILRLRWNFNAVRVPVSSAIWKRDGRSYLDRVGAIVRAANNQQLIVVLANCEDSASGNTAAAGVPVQETVSFWTAWAAYFKDSPFVVFDIFNEPLVDDVPGHVAGQRLSSDWRFWLNGGTGLDGRALVGMQALVNAIRSTGATQLIAASAFHDKLDFQGFTSEFFVRDSNVIYEVHPFFDHGLTDSDRDRNFGFLVRSVPVYAGAWGLELTQDSAACRSVPANPEQATDLLNMALEYFDNHAISWTASSFETNSLVRNLSTFDPTQLDRRWTCGAITNPQPGMGEVILLELTEDATGFGVIDAELVANAAGGPSGPLAPGEIIAIFGFLFGPPSDIAASLDASGMLPRSLADVRLLLDGEPAPLFSVGPFQITAQVPFSVQGKTQTSVQLFYKQVPSNTVVLEVVESAPRIVTGFAANQALALNQNRVLNSSANPAEAGSVVALFATGHGETSPPGVTGRAAHPPYGQPTMSVSLTVAGATADVLYAAEAPGLVGLLQVNARVPGVGSARAEAVPVVLKIGGQSSLPGVTVWVR